MDRSWNWAQLGDSGHLIGMAFSPCFGNSCRVLAGPLGRVSTASMVDRTSESACATQEFLSDFTGAGGVGGLLPVSWRYGKLEAQVGGRASPGRIYLYNI